MWKAAPHPTLPYSETLYPSSFITADTVLLKLMRESSPDAWKLTHPELHVATFLTKNISFERKT
jgi:hypothetical protein